MIPKGYHEQKAYQEAGTALCKTGRIVLLAFAKNDCLKKDIIVRNFLARSLRLTASIFDLWECEDYQSAWSLHRLLLDRLFHLHSIGSNNEFAEFEEWSFFEQYKKQNRVRSDPDFKKEASGWVYELSDEQKKRADFLSKNKPGWRRPRIEDVAKEMGMKFLYNYGYDYASSHVHPMHDDGLEDFFKITGVRPSPEFPSQISLLSNTILAYIMVLQEVMNLSSLKWNKALYDFIDKVGAFLRDGTNEYVDIGERILLLPGSGTVCSSA